MYKYQKVADQIIRDIKLELLRPGTALPTDDSLMKKYGVSRVTVRKSISYLIEKGVVDNAGNKRMINDTKLSSSDGLNHFQPLIYAIAQPEITNVITECAVEQANPYSDEIFKRNVGAYFKANLWYQHLDTIIANTQSIIPAELVSGTGTDMYDKKAVQVLIEQTAYQVGYNSEVHIDAIDPCKHTFDHAIQGASNAIFFKLTERIFNDNQQTILFNELYLSTKNAMVTIHTS
ncbi:winged helix-turn-helix domain-containing protein [Levilactobacillus tujiorum]|uniref:Winged helix-turn-helix transcriptional regulator n=1 Tax=Levilactobacillus tujiorum TaxID=2912243 RepID=A0ABX1L9P3_9LACO|nr:winged helix-turn-helix domain-containing protein [Levilactobacillus tujiorum]MCH5465491.1 winged helix-turn-helix domain-containing protein [Levilactobacillus tujiorum]NLR12577.1 winged helix-turn-helix transcriptional regulator [Lactobacillus sp. HBUAS51387]NLR29780.1 winged helix-turn-helix transcriptional regulator [Levilactobacillus tujiorum]